MIALLFALWHALHPSTAEVRAFRKTAPHYLTADSARENLVAARVAAALTDTHPADLLSIAWFESRYTPDVVTHEPGHKVSCGIMTPIPKKHCRPGGVLVGYLRGAAHWRGWLHNRRCRGRRLCAILGYAGGGRLISACAEGPHYATRRHQVVDLCEYVPTTRFGRARVIRHVIARSK